MEQTELVVASAIVALRESMKLYVAGFQMGGPSERAASGWPDFARYDCYACHHELQAFGPSSRADPTGESGAIGRPTIPNWSQVLVGLGVEAVDPKAAAGRLAHIKSLLRRFREALRAQPFGDRELASKVALEIVDWSNPVLTELEAMTEAHEGAADRVIDRKVAIGLLHRLCQIGRESALDYDAARQVAWAFRTIYREVVPTPSDRLPDALRALDSELDLTLRRGAPPGSTATGRAAQKEPILDSLAERLKAIANYKPDFVTKQLDVLEEILPPY